MAVEIQSLGPAVLTPSEALGNIVLKANSLLSDHREWLSNLNSEMDNSSPLPPSPPSPPPPTTTSTSPHSTITTPPSLQNRAPEPFPNPAPQVPTELCNCTPGIISASSSAASSASIAFSASISSISSAAQASAAAGIASAQASAGSAIGVANASASNASTSLVAATNSAIAATNSASSAISSIQASASSAVASAISSANSQVSSVSVQLAAAQVSASVANALASEAKATATFAIAQALATVSSVNSQASLSIQGARIQAMNNTRFALVITFSILGSSLLSILIFYLIIRTRRRRRERREERKLLISYPQYIERRSRSMRRSNDTGNTTGSDDDREAILAEFPLPVNASSWARPRSASNPPPHNPAREREREVDQRRTVMGNERLGSGLDRNPYYQDRDREKEGGFGRRERRESEPVIKPVTARKNTLTYDPERPDQPPRFRSWWEENGGDISEKSNGMGMGRGRQRESLRPGMRESVRPEMGNVTTGLGISMGDGGTYDPEQRGRERGNGNGNNRASEIGRSLVDRVVGRKSQIGTAF